MSQGSMSISWLLIGATRWPPGGSQLDECQLDPVSRMSGRSSSTVVARISFSSFPREITKYPEILLKSTCAAAKESGCPGRPFEPLAGTTSIHSVHEYWDGTLVPVCAEIEMTEADSCCSTEEIDSINTV